jgi:hypothetical protein
MAIRLLAGYSIGMTIGMTVGNSIGSPVGRPVDLRLLLLALPFTIPPLRFLPNHPLQIRVRDPHLSIPTDDAVPLYGSRVDPFQTPSEAQLCERGDSPGLQEFADDAIRLGQVALQQQDLASARGQTVGEGTAGDAAPDDYDVGLDIVELGA